MKKIESYFIKNGIDYELSYNPYVGIYKLITLDEEPHYNIKGVKVDYTNFYIGVVHYVTEEDAEKLEIYNKYQFALNMLFYSVRSKALEAGEPDTKATQDAVKAQYEYATKHNCINVFNNIYQ